MPNLTLENVPQDFYDQLQRDAQANQRTIAEEALQRLLRRRLPDEPFLTEEISAPCTIPLPGPGIPVKARQGGEHLPDPPWIMAEPQ